MFEFAQTIFAILMMGHLIWMSLCIFRQFHKIKLSLKVLLFLALVSTGLWQSVFIVDGLYFDGLFDVQQNTFLLASYSLLGFFILICSVQREGHVEGRARKKVAFQLPILIVLLQSTINRFVSLNHLDIFLGIGAYFFIWLLNFKQKEKFLLGLRQATFLFMLTCIGHMALISDNFLFGNFCFFAHNVFLFQLLNFWLVKVYLEDQLIQGKRIYA